MFSNSVKREQQKHLLRLDLNAFLREKNFVTPREMVFAICDEKTESLIDENRDLAVHTEPTSNIMAAYRISNSSIYIPTCFHADCAGYVYGNEGCIGTSIKFKYTPHAKPPVREDVDEEKEQLEIQETMDDSLNKRRKKLNLEFSELAIEIIALLKCQPDFTVAQNEVVSNDMISKYLLWKKSPLRLETLGHEVDVQPNGVLFIRNSETDELFFWCSTPLCMSQGRESGLLRKPFCFTHRPKPMSEYTRQDLFLVMRKLRVLAGGKDLPIPDNDISVQDWDKMIQLVESHKNDKKKTYYEIQGNYEIMVLSTETKRFIYKRKRIYPEDTQKKNWNFTCFTRGCLSQPVKEGMYERKPVLERLYCSTCLKSPSNRTPIY